MADKDPIRVGILYSETGVTSTIGLSQLQGALLGIDEINEAGGIDGRELVAVRYDPQSTPSRYAELAERLIVQDGVNVIFGCYMSSSRKAVIPVIEKWNKLLFYPTLYEGFEYSSNVIYTGAAGDEPAATVELVGFAQSLGFEVVAAGKGKNNPLKFDATPDAFEEEARARKMNPRMLVEFVDGSKTMIEMTAVANATGLMPDIPGMHGPSASRDQIAQTLCTKADGGILNRSGAVDYSIGPGVAPGVFCDVKPRHPRVLERMIDLKVGPGPCFTLMRPYHLTSLEVPLSAIRAAKSKLPDLEPLDHPVAECVAVAKRDLNPGDRLGKIGEYDYRGFAMCWSEARDSVGLPLGLAERATVLKPIRAGDKLTYENCAPDDALLITQIRRRLDQSDAAHAAA